MKNLSNRDIGAPQEEAHFNGLPSALHQMIENNNHKKTNKGTKLPDPCNFCRQLPKEDLD